MWTASKARQDTAIGVSRVVIGAHSVAEALAGSAVGLLAQLVLHLLLSRQDPFALRGHLPACG